MVENTAPLISDNKSEVRNKSGTLKCESEPKAKFKSLVRGNA